MADELQPQAVETPPLSAGSEAAPGSTSADADGESLADHAALFGPQDPSLEGEAKATNDDARAKVRHRASSQQAGADDVSAINELTKRLKAAEETAGKDIPRKAGESERVYTLRRRAELAERLTAPPKPQAPSSPAPSYQPQRQSQPIPQAFPDYETFVAVQGNEHASYDDYTDARADWRYAMSRAQERQQAALEQAQRAFQDSATAHQQRVASAKTRYADFDTVVNAPDLPPITFVLRDAILASSQSEEIQYHLGKHRDVLHALVAESQDYSPSAVAAMRRYLDTLVVPASRPAAGSTGSVLALAPPPAPRPPNLVRTGTARTDEGPSDDSMSISEHEKAYGRRRR